VDAIDKLGIPHFDVVFIDGRYVCLLSTANAFY
jgi:hypothetical protein